MENKEYTTKQEQIARFAKAMGHPARIAILNFLAKQDCCFFGDIHEVLPISKATVSQHLKELKDAGLIQGEIETPKVKYCINRENWEKLPLYFLPSFSGNVYARKKVVANSGNFFSSNVRSLAKYKHLKYNEKSNLFINEQSIILMN